MNKHQVYFVSDDALPMDHDFVFTVCEDGVLAVFYRESALSPQLIEESWTAYRLLGEAPRVTLRSVS